MNTLNVLCLAMGMACTCTNGAVAQEQSLDDLFTGDRLIEVEIFVTDQDWDEIRFQSRDFRQALQASRQFGPVESPYSYVPATVIIDGVVYPQVGLRKKGFFGSQDTERPSLKIKLDKFDQDLNIDGVTNLTLNNNKQDRSLMSQFMGYELFNTVGSPAPRCGYAKVVVNGENLGVYSHVETLREPALERGFGNAEGTLFEGTVVDFYPDWEDSFERKLGRNKPGRKKIRQVIEALAGGGGTVVFGGKAPGRGWVPEHGRHDLEWMLPEFDDSNWTPGLNGAGYEQDRGYEDLIQEGFDFGRQMHRKATSLYLRFPFEVEDIASIRNARTLSLRMKCDDGFIAYLNGVEVARQNAPEAAHWQSRAANAMGDEAAIAFREYDITPFQELMVEGPNVLAVHGLNNTRESSDFLVVAEIQYGERNFLEELWQHVDEESFYRFWAMEGLLSFWDGYSGNRNNFFIYLNPETDKLHFMPWGADCLFENYSPIANDRNAPRSVRALGLIPNRLYQLPETRAKYARTMRMLLQEVWDEDALMAETRRLEAMLAPQLSGSQRWSVDFDHIRRFIRGRKSVIENEINGPDMPVWNFAPGDVPRIPDDDNTRRDRRGENRRNAADDDQRGVDPTTPAGFLIAAAQDDMRTLKAYVEAGGDVDFTDEGGGTALGIAALAGHTEAVKYLIEEGANVNLYNWEGNGPLVGAALFGQIDTTRILLEAGADPTHRNLKGETPIDIASFPWGPELQGVVQFVSGLVQIDTDMNDVRKNRPRVAQILREWEGPVKGANPDDGGKTIWMAAKTGDLDRMRTLLDKDVDHSGYDNLGITPLSWAAVSGHPDVARMLMEAGADPNQPNRDQGTPLHAASFLGHGDVVVLLVESGARINARNGDRQTSLDTVSEPWSPQLAEVVNWVGSILEMKVDPQRVRKSRPKIAEQLRKLGGLRSADLD
ncbi:MAG: CotH kinase family protein [Phycisphaerales bacterium]|nr:CotH kinase family protein [Phycisphaerales bacterium]